MSTSTADNDMYQLEEGHLSVDFVNTSYIKIDETAPIGYTTIDESLTDLAALGAWGVKVGLLQQSEADLLNQPPDKGSESRLVRLRELREALRQVIRAHLHEHAIPEPSLDILNQSFTPLCSQSRLVATDEGFRVERADAVAKTRDQVFDCVFWSIGQSAINLLTDPEELDMITECPADDCGYLFRDTSHGRRRWCSMKSCGNRAKVHRFRERQKASA